MSDSHSEVPSKGEEIQWHALPKEDACIALGVESDVRRHGLSSDDAKTRLEKYGLNQLTEKERKTFLQRIWNLVYNVLVGILVFVAIVSLIKAITAKNSEDRLTNLIEVGLIAFVVIQKYSLNTCIGLYQEGSAEKAAEALKNMLSSDAVLIRDGKEIRIPAAELVPGDVVVLGTGDRVPADMRLLEVNNLACQEAALTGESVPIDKITEVIASSNPQQVPLGDRKNMCFSATLVSQGYGVGIVVATGDNTEIGNINQLVNKQETKRTAVLQQIAYVSKIIALFVTITAIITWLVAFFMIDASPADALNIALTCAVAMIPEGLDSIVTMTYSWSVAVMAKHNAIIRILPSVETLGSVTVICSDKTGTLTKNEMTLTAFVTSDTRYKVNVNATERTNANFIADNGFLSQRADQAAGKSAKEIIRGGPSASRGSNFHGRSDFGFSMHGLSYHSEAGNRDFVEDPIDQDRAADDEKYGQSPDQNFIRQALSGGVLCSKCSLGTNGGRQGEIGNPTELSILRACYFADINVSEMKAEAPIVAEVPFSSEYKFMATIHEPSAVNDGYGYDDEYIVHVKGAPDRMLKLCVNQAKGGVVGKLHEEPINGAYWTEQIAILSSHGLRVLALCRGTVSKSSVNKSDQLKPTFVNGRAEPWLTMVGLCAIQDPPRPECVDAIKEAHGAGVRVAMITGDHKDTALAIGSQLGIVDKKYSDAITGPEMDSMNEEELKLAVMQYNIFARASPENKIQIVKALQAQGQVCSMTGDGVNDAPALKAADMGVAMGKEGTDVAREASEMILADDNFATIIAAVREGRTVWDNLRKVLFINTPINNAQGMSVLFGIICGLEEAPLTPIQVLYCNLICAVTLGFVAAVEPAEDGIMQLPPRRVGKRLIGRYLLLRIAIGTIVLVATTVGSVFWVKGKGYDMKEIRSQALNTLSFGACAITLSARFAYNSSFHPRVLTGNPFCWYSCLIMLVLQLLITYVPGLNDVVFGMAPMDGFQWAIVAIFMVVTFIVMELEKAVRRHLSQMGKDTDDREIDEFFDDRHASARMEPLPKNHLNLTELKK